MSYRHTSVLTAEIVEGLGCAPGHIIADCTLGGAGHARAILEKVLPGGMLIGIDRDSDAIENAKTALRPYLDQVRIFHGNYLELGDILSREGIAALDGVVMDLGLSFHQIDSGGRGFGFGKDEPLDMRMDIRDEISAEYLVNRLPEGELKRILIEFGEERWAGRIARNIAFVRKTEPVRTSRQLTDIVLRSIPADKRHGGQIHPATRVFMALRIAVNRELECLERFLGEAMTWLRSGGRLAVISFHSLEDRIVKTKMKTMEGGCECSKSAPKCVCQVQPIARRVHRKALRPTEAEINRNPMARSARLRIAEKL